MEQVFQYSRGELSPPEILGSPPKVVSDLVIAMQHQLIFAKNACSQIQSESK